MNPAKIEKLLSIAEAANTAGHGKKQAIYQAGAKELGVSMATLQRDLKSVTVRDKRKRRSDAGKSSLSLDEAKLISAYLVESQRKNNKRLASFKTALETLRSNGVVVAARLNEGTGELEPLSEAAVSRALTAYNLHPDQLKRDTPKTQLASLHPNHVWQIDPSLCVLYYLPSKKGQCIQVMDEKKFYKNKPANISKIEKERVWRYVITDHTSGVIFIHYVLGAESGKNLVDAFVSATQKRHPSDPFCGIPKMVMVDPGSANTGAVFKNLCYSLNVKLQVNTPHTPWAKGQVEKANDIVECHFEHRLKAMANPPTSVDELNAVGAQWMRWFNSTQVMSRTKKTRYATWLQISQKQLILAPSDQLMRELSYHAPEHRKVTSFLEVSYRGKTYSVADIPGVTIGEKILITRNPWRDEDAQVIYTNADGIEVMQVVKPQQHNEFGFSETAAVIGEEYKAHADTQLDKNRKEIERIAMSASTQEEAEANRKKQHTPFGGSIDPMKPITDTQLPDYIKKRGTELDVQGPQIEQPTLHIVQVAKRLRTRMGSHWQPEHYQWLQKHYADGVTEDELDAVEQRLRRKISSPLQLVNEG